MKIAIGSDHGGYEAKNKLSEYLKSKNYEVIDCGTFSSESCNYAEYGIKVAQNVANNEADLGVVICTSGEGICIAANKVKGIRCGIGYNDEVSKLLRNHNDANIISFGAAFMSLDEIIKRTEIFINEPFLGERHKKRVDFIKKFEH